MFQNSFENTRGENFKGFKQHNCSIEFVDNIKNDFLTQFSFHRVHKRRKKSLYAGSEEPSKQQTAFGCWRRMFLEPTKSNFRGGLLLLASSVISLFILSSARAAGVVLNLHWLSDRLFVHQKTTSYYTSIIIYLLLTMMYYIILCRIRRGGKNFYRLLSGPNRPRSIPEDDLELLHIHPTTLVDPGAARDNKKNVAQRICMHQDLNPRPVHYKLRHFTATRQLETLFAHISQ